MELPAGFETAISGGSTTILTAVGAVMVLGLAIGGAIWAGKKVWRAFKGAAS